ncbi:hypothetical protein Tco_1448533 [Tanacetum coccineum]
MVLWCLLSSLSRGLEFDLCLAPAEILLSAATWTTQVYEVRGLLYEPMIGAEAIIGWQRLSTSTALVDPYHEINDSLVVIWMYYTISPKLVDMVVDDSATACKVWKHLKDIFHDNKDARVIKLDYEIRNINIGNLSVTDYFQHIEGKVACLAN